MQCKTTDKNHTSRSLDNTPLTAALCPIPIVHGKKCAYTLHQTEAQGNTKCHSHSTSPNISTRYSFNGDISLEIYAKH